MTLSEKIVKELNAQLNLEFESGYLYLSMSVFFEEKNLSGMAKWMRLQYDEEREHALKFLDFILERNETPVLSAFAEPKKNWESPLDAFEDAYKHEQMITGQINKIMDTVVTEKDYATKVFLDFFVAEQVEEESTVLAIVDQLKMIGDSPSALFFLNNELDKRIVTPE